VIIEASLRLDDPSETCRQGRSGYQLMAVVHQCGIGQPAGAFLTGIGLKLCLESTLTKPGGPELISWRTRRSMAHMSSHGESIEKSMD
jgi:hypothetical protein